MNHNYSGVLPIMTYFLINVHNCDFITTALSVYSIFDIYHYRIM